MRIEDRKPKRSTFFFPILFIGLMADHFGYTQEDYSRSEKIIYEQYRSVNKNFEKGRMFFDAGNLVKARKEFQTVIDRMKEHSEAHFYLSRISYQENKYDEALTHIESAKDHYAFISKMKINMHENLLTELRAIKEGIINELASYPSKSKVNPAVSKLEGKLRTINNRLSEPVPEKEETPAGYYYFHGNILVKLKKYQEAQDQYLEAVRINPKYGDAYNNLASLYYLVKKYAQAMEYLKLAEENGAEVNPKFKEALDRQIQK